MRIEVTPTQGAAAFVVVIALAGGSLLARGPSPAPAGDREYGATATHTAPAQSLGPMVEATPPVAAAPPASASVPDAEPPRSASPLAPENDSEYWRLADIEDFKREIYALDIDTLDQVDQLDALVHVETDDPRELWGTDWAGVDDWKRYEDGFTLERAHDGTLLFVPGAETQRQYSFFESVNTYAYDEENQSFIHEVDYYGKPIFNVVKFLREDVLVMMTVSGEKVDLNIYEQGAEAE